VTLLPVHVDTLEVLQLLHEDEPFVGHPSEDQIGYINAQQKFRTRA